MVEFEYQPWKKIIIHEIVEFPPDYFLDNAARAAPEGGTSPPLQWAKGIIFIRTPLPPTEDVVGEQIKGIIHWSALHFGRMRRYQKEIKRERSVTVPIIDLSEHETLGAMAEWIKETHIQK
jgi:hypothetical protein